MREQIPSRKPIERPKTESLMGKLLERVHNARHFSRLTAIDAMWERNGMASVASRKGFKIAETTSVFKDGTEVVEYKLYKLIDATTVTVSAEVNTKVEQGVASLKENK